jgi:hypothetical protein
VEYDVRPCPDQERAEKTTEKIRRGGLPSPAEHRRDITVGDGTACDGCPETIAPMERMYNVHCGVLNLRFHDDCYMVWIVSTR